MFRKCTIGLDFVSILALVAILAGPLGAQSITGTISGTVVDPSGAIVPGAEVTLTNEATGTTYNTASSDAGEFVFTGLQPARYALKIEKAGFRGVNRKGIQLTSSERVGLGTIQLELGEVSDTVEVTIQGEAVTTESADTSGVLSLKQLDSIPVKGRDVMNLLRTLPGVSQVAAQPWGPGEFGDNDPAGGQSN
jgi:hypothetical protein